MTMTLEHREKLAKRITEYLRREWGSEYRDEDTAKIYDFCMDEVEDISYPFTEDDIELLAVQYELKYG